MGHVKDPITKTNKKQYFDYWFIMLHGLWICVWSHGYGDLWMVTNGNGDGSKVQKSSEYQKGYGCGEHKWSIIIGCIRSEPCIDQNSQLVMTSR